MNTAITTIRPPVRRRRWLSVLLGIGIFLAGLAVGAALTIIFAVGILQYILHHPENNPSRITAVLTRKLQLDATQHDKVLDIISRHQIQIQVIRRQMRPQFEQQLDQIRAEVDAILTYEQRVRWDELFDRIREHWTPKLIPAASTEPSTP